MDSTQRLRRSLQQWLLLALLGAASALAIPGCQLPDPLAGKPAQFAPGEYPAQLSQWRLLARTDAGLALNAAAVPYDVNMPLFTDYASKHRALWLPAGTTINVAADERLTFPVGAIISKSFFYDEGHAGNRQLQRHEGHRAGNAATTLLETRLLVREPNGWIPLSYIWNGQDAQLTRTGAIIDVALDSSHSATFPYVVPTRNECAKCHALDSKSEQLAPIGLTLAQLTGTAAGGGGALKAMIAKGWLAEDAASKQPMARWTDGAMPEATIPAFARDYLDSNCAHCHSDTGSAKNSGLHLQRATTDPRAMGICKPPIAAGKGSGGRLYSIVPGEADASILSYRMASTDPSRRMPETGRSLAHAQGLALTNQWINGLSGDCL